MEEKTMDEAKAGWTARDSARAYGLPDLLAYTITETSHYSGVKQATIRAAIKNGELASFLPIGATKPFLIRPEAVDEWIEKSERSGRAAKVMQHECTTTIKARTRRSA